MAGLAGPAYGGAAAGWGHELRPAYFQINETRGELHLTWKQPVRGDMALKLVPRLSSGWLARTPVSSINTGDYLIRQWRIPATEATALHGTTFRVEGLEKSIAFLEEQLQESVAYVRLNLSKLQRTLMGTLR